MRYEEFTQSSILRDAFYTYRRNNLVKSQASFSVRILGRQPTYYSSMVSRKRCPSPRVLETLLNVTKTILATFMGNRHFGSSYALNLNAAYEDLERLAVQVQLALEMCRSVDGLEEAKTTRG